MASVRIQTTKPVVPMIYAYTTPGIPYHDGWTKIGYTEQDVTARINQQTHTAGIKWELQWKKNALFDDGSGRSFRDSDFHAYMQKQGVRREAGTEWFEITGSDSKRMINLCQEDDETYSVIDGQQRITSLVRFLSNSFELKSLEELPELNGKFYKDLDKPLQKKLKSSSLKTITLLKQSQDLKYEIFARLNQGAVALTPQELRNCIYRGTFNSMLEDLAKNASPTLKTLFIDENKRKRYQERILRFFALRQFTSYKSSMKKTMNAYMEAHKNDDITTIQEQKVLFSTTISCIKQVLGESAFTALNTQSVQFSASIYDSIIIPFSFYSNHDLMQHANEIRDAIANLRQSNEQYKQDAYVSTGDRKRVIGRIMAVYNLLQKIIGSASSSSEPRLFSDDVKEKLFHPGYICSYCQNEILSIDDAEVDHIIPYSLGGTTDISNAQLLHILCNREKSASLDPDFETDEDNEDFEGSEEIEDNEE